MRALILLQQAVKKINSTNAYSLKLLFNLLLSFIKTKIMKNKTITVCLIVLLSMTISIILPSCAAKHPTSDPKRALKHPTSDPKRALKHPTSDPKLALKHPTSDPKRSVRH